MCCEACFKYERCERNKMLRDNCCNKCPDYSDCVGIYEDNKNSYEGNKDSYEDDRNEMYY